MSMSPKNRVPRIGFLDTIGQIANEFLYFTNEEPPALAFRWKGVEYKIVGGGGITVGDVVTEIESRLTAADNQAARLALTIDSAPHWVKQTDDNHVYMCVDAATSHLESGWVDIGPASGASYTPVVNQAFRLALPNAPGQVAWQVDEQELWMQVLAPATSTDNWILLNGAGSTYETVANQTARLALPDAPGQFALESGKLYFQMYTPASSPSSWKDLTGTETTLLHNQTAHGLFANMVGYMDANNQFVRALEGDPTPLFVKSVVDANTLELAATEGKVILDNSPWIITGVGGEYTNSRYIWIGENGVWSHEAPAGVDNPQLFGYFVKPGYYVVGVSVQPDLQQTNLTDADAIHKSIAGEIAGMTEKVSPTAADWVVIESAADGNAKRKAKFPAAGSGTKPANVSNLNDAFYRAAGVYSGADATVTGAGGYTNGPANLAVGEDFLLRVDVSVQSTGDVSQVLIAQDGEVYARHSTSGTAWGAWRRLDNTNIAWQALGTTGALTYDCLLGVNAKIPDRTGNITVPGPTNVDDGETGQILIQGTTNAFTITWSAPWDFQDATEPVIPASTTEAVLVSWTKNGTKFHSTSAGVFTY